MNNKGHNVPRIDELQFPFPDPGGGGREDRGEREGGRDVRAGGKTRELLKEVDRIDRIEEERVKEVDRIEEERIPSELSRRDV